MNYRPLTTRKKAQLLMVLTLVVWATTLLLHQWGYGAEAPADGDGGNSGAPAERFVTPEAHSVTLVLRSEITVHGTEVKFRQLCRWADADGSFFAPMADLIIARCKPDAAFQSVGIDEIRNTLHDAGVNVALIHFNGPTLCTIARSDVQFDERQAMQDWISAKHGKEPADPAGASASILPAKGSIEDAATLSSARVRVQSTPVLASAAGRPQAAAPDPKAPRTLRDLIVADAAIRLNIPAEQLQLTFNPKDEHLLALPETQFKFNLEARRVYNLGDVAWDVLIVTDAGSRKAMIAGTARAWERQAVAAKPLGYKQVIRDGDLTERRVLVDRLPDEPLLLMSQAIGQQAARDLKPGTILSARMVDPVQLVKTGQFVTVTLNSGQISVKTVVRALEGGSYGQTIRVKNESTRDTYEVVVTGPQEGSMSPVPEERRVADAAN